MGVTGKLFSKVKATEEEVFGALNNAINIDFSNYNNDLSSSLANSTSMNKHLKKNRGNA